jgi:hypothetical protein
MVNYPGRLAKTLDLSVGASIDLLAELGIESPIKYEDNHKEQKSFGESYYEIAQYVRPISDGGYIVAGDVTPDPSGAFVILLKLDLEGNISWQKR